MERQTTTPRSYKGPRAAVLKNSYYPIMQYNDKFKNVYMNMKSSFSGLNANIQNYKKEIQEMSDLLIMINNHENNYKGFLRKLVNLKKHIEETIEIENLIVRLGTNQQIINITEYVQLHNKVCEIIQFFKDSQVLDKEDYIENMKVLMKKGFKVYEETFYIILKRYDQLDGRTTINENERLNLLSKIRSLAECLQNETFGYNFTWRLVQERSDKIKLRFDTIKINFSKSTGNNDDLFEKNSGVITNVMIESEKLFSKEKDYILIIFDTCSQELKRTTYVDIIREPCNIIINSLKDMIARHKKESVKRIDFFNLFDIINIWYSTINNSYKIYVEDFERSIYGEITNCIRMMEGFAFAFLENFIKEINCTAEKPENENVMNINNQTLFWLSKIIKFENAYDMMVSQFQLNDKEFSVQLTINTMINKLEHKSHHLEKKYPPLKYIFLINNIYFVLSKIRQPDLGKYVEKTFANTLNERIKEYTHSYLECTWKKILNETLNENNYNSIVIYENDGKTLKNSSREMIKKKFANFNEEMKLNLKFQKQIKIIDSSIEKVLVQSNIDYISQKYQDFYDIFSKLDFTKFPQKYILYTSQNDVVQDLKMYFIDSLTQK